MKTYKQTNMSSLMEAWRVCNGFVLPTEGIEKSRIMIKSVGVYNRHCHYVCYAVEWAWEIAARRSLHGTREITDDSVIYLRKDGKWYRSCGELGFYDSFEEAKNNLRNSFESLFDALYENAQ